jgi:CheY-like chemotaxis protein
MPDLILTDLSMPGTNGLELIGRLKADGRTKDIPIVMFSSSAGPDDRERALAAGCVAFYEKPVGLAGLTEMLHAIGSLLKTV